MRIAVVGSGGREHALLAALAQSAEVDRLFAVPGNAGTAEVAENVPGVGATDATALASFAEARRIDLTIVGPEQPLVAGVADEFLDRGLPVFGPTATAARIEGSKAFAKEIMAAAGVPTARSESFTDPAAAVAALDDFGPPWVVKADGLAAGKGVVIAAGEAEARAALEEMLVARRFGEQPVVVEEFLAGDELSLLALCDGERAIPLAPARDYKRIGDGDSGPNTGGMGSFSPVPGTDELVRDVVASVHQPVVEELARRGTPFHGVLYAGLMLGEDGPKVLEFNVRFGDPETQVVLPRLRSDLLALLIAATETDGLAGAELDWDPRAAVCVVLASRGYPARSSSGDVIAGLDALPAGVEVFHAGTAERHGDVVTAGGRVLGVTALGDDRDAARSAAYAAADVIAFDGAQLRRDIAA
jgi:phosphoribosylamine---glycine ligase